MSTELAEFNKYPVRRIWHKGEWYYSVIDVVALLSDSKQPRGYWNKIKARAKTEGFEETMKEVIQLKLVSPDGKLRETDTANQKTMFRLMQSIPSPKAEPFRLWLAEIGQKEVRALGNTDNILERVKQKYRVKGYSEDWIKQRIESDVIRNALTDEWLERGADGTEYSILTNEIHKGTFELTVQAHKDYKVLPKNANLRDHTSLIELALISLGEATSITIHQERDSQGFNELHRDTQNAGAAAGEARKGLEKSLGHSVISSENFLPKLKSKKKVDQASMFDLLPTPDDDNKENK